MGKSKKDRASPKASASEKGEMDSKKPADLDPENRSEEEFSKKLKDAVPTSSSPSAVAAAAGATRSEDDDERKWTSLSPLQDLSSKSGRSTLTPAMAKTTMSVPPFQQTLDLESALYKMILLSPKEQDKKEYLIEPCIQEERDDSTSKPPPALWVSFRLAHTGDAATLAALYCKRSSQSSSEQQESYNQNEEQISLWLADGLGDEDTPPSVYGLLAEVYQDDEKVAYHQLGAAVLLTAAWQDDQRVIRIEWYTVKPEYLNLEGHVLLRLASLALWTDSALVWVQPMGKTSMKSPPSKSPTQPKTTTTTQT